MPNKFTKEEIEKILSSRGYRLLEDYKDINSRHKIIDLEGYLYYVAPSSAYYQNGTYYRFGKNNPFSIENIKLWILKNDRKIELISDVFVSAISNMQWKCMKDGCGSLFVSDWHKIHNGSGCTYCASKTINATNCLAKSFPKCVDEWDFEKNKDITPFNIAPYSNKIVWWICKKCGYNWECDISTRVNQTMCPACWGSVVTDRNRLSIVFPEIAKEWNYEKNNDLMPSDVSYGVGKKVWWKCSEYGHEWISSINNRTNQGRNCPYCKKSKGELLIKEFLFNNNINFIPQYRFKDCKLKRSLPFDFGIFKHNNLIALIEYDGEFHFKKYYLGKMTNKLEETQRNDKIKTDYCESKRIKLIRIPYWEKENISQILIKELSL